MMNAILAVKKEMDFENFESGSLFYLSPGLTWSNKCPCKGLKFLGMGWVEYMNYDNCIWVPWLIMGCHMAGAVTCSNFD